MSQLLFIDHKDSFTHILIDYFEQLGWAVECVQSEHIHSYSIQKYDLIVLSPGFGIPKDKKKTLDFIRLNQGQKPILGICLGHQLLALANKGSVIRAKKPLHGVVSNMEWQDTKWTKGLESIKIMHYHSWVVDKIPLSSIILSRCADSKAIMGLIDEKKQFISWQFHPESIGTEWGLELLEWSIDTLLKLK